ncbi:MAG: hypothetical protein J6Y20_03835 [Lachnospiraceae bacterium]|nr:hypothetical protein [Lachnospiraceae bacterium]
MKRKLNIILLFIMLVFVLAACGDEKPDERESQKKTSPTVTPTEAVATPTAEATPTTEPTQEPTPTAEPTQGPTPTVEPTQEPTPTVEPTQEPTPTVEPTQEPTPTVEPTQEPTPTIEPTQEPTPTAEPTQEPTPTVEPTPAATATPTPTEAPKLPAVAATAGPAYVIGETTWHYYLMDDSDPNQGIHLNLVYIADPGYEALARSVQGMTNYTTTDVYLSYTASASGTSGKEESEILRHFLKSDLEIGRADSLVFSTATRFNGYMTSTGTREYVYTYNYDTKTGEMLSLDQMVTDLDALYNAITEVADKEFREQGVIKDDSWKEIFRKRFFAGTVKWLAVDEGLDFMLDSFNYTSVTPGLLTLHIRVVDYPDLFKPEWVGAYDGSLKRTFDFSSFGTKTYKAIVPDLVKGIRTLTWDEIADMLTKAGVTYEGMNAKEAAKYEQDAELIFFDPDDGKSYRLAFWLFDKDPVDRLEGIYFRFGVNVYIDNAYGTRTEPRYIMVDPWLQDDFEQVFAVSFASEEELRAAVFGAIDNYR